MVVGVVSGAPPSSPPAATAIGGGPLTGSFVISCHIVGGLIGNSVGSLTVALPAHLEKRPKEDTCTLLQR